MSVILLYRYVQILCIVCLISILAVPVSAVVILDTKVSPSTDPITINTKEGDLSVPRDTILASIQYGMNSEGLPITVGTTQWNARGVLLLNDIGEYQFSDGAEKSSWTVYLNGKIQDGFSDTNAALNIVKVAEGDIITGEYMDRSGTSATFSIVIDSNAVNVLTVPTPVPTQELQVRDSSEVVVAFDGILTPSKESIQITSIEGNTYDIPGDTILGLIYAAAEIQNYSITVTDKKWVDGSNEVLLFDNFGPYTYLRGSSAWNMYLNGELADGFISKTRSVNVVTVEEGDVISGEYVDPYGLNATMKITIPGSTNPIKPYITRLKKINSEDPDLLYGNLPSGKRVAVTGMMLADARAQMKVAALAGDK